MPELWAIALSVVVSALLALTAAASWWRLRELRIAARRTAGGYSLVRKIGEGGMGVVWLAKHTFLRRPTALKLLRPESASEEGIRRFEREVQLTSALTHPNTIAIYDYGRTDDGTFFYAMEYLDGIDLQALVKRGGPLSPGIVAHVLGQVCDALSEAHGVGLVHRDIKPANVVLCERGGVPLVAKVVDFGLVRSLEAGERDRTRRSMRFVVGTPHYMAPEAIVSPERVDARTDLYAVGALGYFLATGRPVFEGRGALDVCAQHVHATPVRPSERADRDIPADLEAILLDCLAKDPARRPASAAEISDRLAATRARRELSRADIRVEWARCRAIGPTPPDGGSRAAPMTFGATRGRKPHHLHRSSDRTYGARQPAL